jgi:SAM-dependent methyltransferase
MLTAMQHLLLSTSTHPLLVDIRSRDWLQMYQNHFDTVVSLTALHWLTKVQLAQLYRAVLSALKPGGRLVVGDPFLPDSPSDRKHLHDLQEQYSLREAGMTWDQFWTSFYEIYPIKEMRASHQEACCGGDLFGGSDDGYPISFYLESVLEAGFLPPSIIWKKGLRVVYQAEKPFQ